MANEVRVEDIIVEEQKSLDLKKLTKVIGYKNLINSFELFNFSNYLLRQDENFNLENQIVIINPYDIKHLQNFDSASQYKIFDIFLKSNKVSCVILTDNQQLDEEIINLFNEKEIPLLSSNLGQTILSSKLNIFLSNKLSPNTILHGVLSEVYGIGILMLGKSSIGKSETALELIERGHRLVADDIVEIKISGNSLIGCGSEQIKHHMEIRGLGIINIKTLYGIGAIKESTTIDAIIELEEWDTLKEYDRLGLEEKTEKILGIEVPKYLIPIKIGRNLAIIIEVAAKNQRLKKMGYHSAKEFNKRLLTWIQQNNGIKNRK